MGNRLWAKVNSQQSIVYEQQSMSNSLWATGYGQQAMGNRL